MALKTTQSSTGVINQDRRIVDMSKAINWLEPDAYPLVALTRQIKKKVTINPKFEALEMAAQSRRTTLTAAATAAATTITVADYTILIAGDVIKNTTTGEVLEVSTTPTAAAVTVARSVGATVAQAMSVGEEILIIGNANAEYASARDIRAQQTDTFYNYVQIFRKPFGASGTAIASELYGGAELSVLAKQQGIIHAQDVERAFLFGERALDTSGTHSKRYTGGVLSFISSNVRDALRALTNDGFEDFLIDAFRYGSDKKVLFVSPNVLGVINSWARGKIQVSPAAKTYGMNLMRYESGQGTVTLMKHKLLEGDIYKGYAIMLDMTDVSYRHTSGRDTHIRTNIQANDVDGRMDEYLSECGVQITNQKKHAVLTNAVA